MDPAVPADKGRVSLRLKLDRSSWRTRSVLALLCLGLMVQYLVWRVDSTLPPFEFGAASLFSWGYLVVELTGTAMLAFALVVMARTTNRSSESTEGAQWLASLPSPPLVDVLIPTYNEDLAVLEPTIVGALGLDYPRYRVWVLDDGRRPWLREYCAARGVRYLARDDNRHAKAGNLNHGLTAIACEKEQPEYVTVFDADFVPVPHFLQRTLPLFRDPAVGLVQTPQHFYSDGPIQLNLRASGSWPEEQRLHFDFVLPARDAWGASHCCGTSSVLRASALHQIGGFPMESVTEDYLTTLKLRCVGLRTAYLNERLSHGLAPAGMAEFVGQRARWCLGTMQIIRSRWGPFARNRLPLASRLHLIDHFGYWAVNPVIRLLHFVLPAAYWFGGVFPFQTETAPALAHYVPYSLGVGVVVAWLSAGRVLPVVNDVSQALMAFDVSRAAATGLLRPHRHRFRVTLKRAISDRAVVHGKLLWKFALLLGVNLCGIAYAVVTGLGPGPWPLALMWSAFNILVLGLAAAACVDRARPRQNERLAMNEEARVRWAGAWQPTRILDGSLSGLLLAANHPPPIGAQVVVWLADVGSVRGRVVRLVGEDAFGLSLAPGGVQRDALIRKLFSGRYGSAPETMRLRTTLRSLSTWLAFREPAYA